MEEMHNLQFRVNPRVVQRLTHLHCQTTLQSLD